MRWLGLHGMALALTLLVALGSIVWLYLQKPPTRRALVPALALWAALARDKVPRSAPSRRARSVPSLLLALAIALALILALADPMRASREPPRSVLIAIDRSASMAARDVSPTRLAQAKASARAWIEALPPSASVALVALDRSALPLTSFTRERAALLAALAALEQSDAAGDLLPLAALALDLLSGQPGAELALFSDGNLAHADAARDRLSTRPGLVVHERTVGQSARNVAITRFSLRRYPLDKTHQESLLALTNFGPEREPLALRIRTAGGLLYEERLELPAGASITRSLRDLPSSGALLEAELVLERGPDPLAVDDRAFASLPRRPRTRVLVVSPGDRYLEAALLLDESLDVHELEPSAYQSADGFDVVVFDGVLPPSAPGIAALYLGPPAPAIEGAFPLLRGPIVERPFFDRVEKQHPLLRELALSDVNVARAVTLTPEAGDLALVESETQGATRIPLLVAGARAGVPFLALSFDLRESDLPLRAAFPLFVLRALDQLSQTTSSAPSPHFAGEPFDLALPSGRGPVALRAVAGSSIPLLFSLARVDREALVGQQETARVSVARAGVYTLHRDGQREAIGVNVHAELEGAIAPRRGLLGAPRHASRASDLAPHGELRWWPFLVLIALVLLALEWLTFHRRWTS